MLNTSKTVYTHSFPKEETMSTHKQKSTISLFLALSLQYFVRGIEVK